MYDGVYAHACASMYTWHQCQFLGNSVGRRILSVHAINQARPWKSNVLVTSSSKHHVWHLPGVLPAPWAAASQKQGSQTSLLLSGAPPPNPLAHTFSGKNMHVLHVFEESGLGVHGGNQASPWSKHVLAQTARELQYRSQVMIPRRSIGTGST